MTQAKATPNQADGSSEALREQSTIDHVLKRLSGLDLPARDTL